MKTHIRYLLTAAVATAITTVPPTLFAEDKESAATPAVEASPIDPEALSILGRAVDHLAAAKQFCLTAEIWQEIDLGYGSPIQFTKLVDVRLRRPDRVQLNIRTDVPKRSFYYDGKQLSVLSHKNNFYGAVKAPSTIDEMLTAVEQKAGVSFPLEDVLISKPFGDGAKAATAAEYFGIEPVLDVNCHHLAFQTETIDWQAWVEVGVHPLMRKVVITFKEEEGTPQHTVLFRDWDLSSSLGDFLFTFTPPLGSVKVEMLAGKEVDIDAPASNAKKAE